MRRAYNEDLLLALGSMDDSDASSDFDVLKNYIIKQMEEAENKELLLSLWRDGKTIFNQIMAKIIWDNVVSFKDLL